MCQWMGSYAMAAHKAWDQNYSAEEHFPLLKKISAPYSLIHGYIGAILCIFFILNTLVNLTILRRRQMRTPVNIVLSHIALCDLGTMISYLVYIVWFHIWSKKPDCFGGGYSRSLMNFLLFHSSWSVLLHTTSIWLAAILAFVRLAVMKSSNLGNRLFQAASCRKWIFWVLILVVATGFPIVMTNQVVELRNIPFSRCGNKTSSMLSAGHRMDSYTVCASRIALKHNYALLRITLLVNGILFKLAPCIILMIAVLGLLRTFNEAKERRLRLSTDYVHDPPSFFVSIIPSGQAVLKVQHLDNASIRSHTLGINKVDDHWLDGHHRRVRSTKSCGSNGRYSDNQPSGTGSLHSRHNRSNSQRSYSTGSRRSGGSLRGNPGSRTDSGRIRHSTPSGSSQFVICNSPRSANSRPSGGSSLSSTAQSVRLKQFNPRTTKMLVAILSIFMVAELPQAALSIAGSIFTHDVYFHIYPLVGDIMDMLSLLNSSVNFVLYCAMSSRYRMAFKRAIKSIIKVPRWKIRNVDAQPANPVVHVNSCRAQLPATSLCPNDPSVAEVMVHIPTDKRIAGSSDCIENKTATYNLSVSKSR